MKQKYRYKKRKFYFTPTPKVTGILFGFALIAYSYVFGVKYLKHSTHLFTLEDIKISGLNYLGEDEIKKPVQTEIDKQLYDIQVDKIAKEILKNKYIRAVSVSRNIPSTLLIDIKERTPVLFLLDKSLYIVDETGIILKKLAKMPTQGLPVVTGITVNELLQDREPLYQALEIMNIIKEVDKTLFAYVSEVNLQKDKWPVLFLIQGGAKVILGNSQYYERVYLWSELFRQAPIINKLDQIKKIDFTFSGRVVIEYKT
jgi:cell division protein FtsQ